MQLVESVVPVWHRVSMAHEYPLRVAAQLLNISRQTLAKRLKARGLEPERRVVRGTVTCWVTQEQMDEAMLELHEPGQHPAHTQQPASTPAVTQQHPTGTQVATPHRLLQENSPAAVAVLEAAAPAASPLPVGAAPAAAGVPVGASEVATLREQLEVAVAARMKAEALLAAAEKIEKATGTRCDKLEARLAHQDGEMASLRLELGEQRGLAQSLQLMLTGGAAAERAHQRKSWWGRMLGR